MQKTVAVIFIYSTSQSSLKSAQAFSSHCKGCQSFCKLLEAKAYPNSAQRKSPWLLWSMGEELSNHDVNAKIRAHRGKAHPSTKSSKSAADSSSEVANVPTNRNYGNKMFKHELLSKEEEQSLAQLVQRLQSHEETRLSMAAARGLQTSDQVNFQDWAEELGTTPLELQRELLVLRDAKETLVTKNLRLVASIAQQFTLPYGTEGQLSMADLIQEGFLGLIRAVEKFEPDRGFRFSTYATFWVKQRIRLYLRTRLIKKPLGLQALSESMHRLNKQHAAIYNREMTNAELAAALQITEKRVFNVKEKTLPIVSLDAPLPGGNPEFTLADLVSIEDNADDQVFAYTELQQELEWSMKRNLNDVERDIVRMRIGLDDGKQKSLRELGKVLKMTPAMIRKNERSAFSKLRTQQLHEQLLAYTRTLENI